MGYFEDCKAAFLTAKSEADIKAASLKLDDVDFNILTSAQQSELWFLEDAAWAQFEATEDQQWAAPV